MIVVSTVIIFGRNLSVAPAFIISTRSFGATILYLALKPGMFATLNIKSALKDKVLQIPTEAIINTGEKQIVFVVKTYGSYEAREITTGLVANNMTQVASGLHLDEEVVMSGQFLLDSESQLKEAVQKLLAEKLQQKNNKELSPQPGTSLNKNKDEKSFYYTCSMHPQIVKHEPGTCPICHMDLVKKNIGK